MRVEVRGSVVAMQQSFMSFGIGLLLAIVLVYLILMAQFASFIDPFIILLAIPSGITGVILFLLITHTTLNVMSLMGVIMMTGIVVSNSILIVDVTRNYREGGMPIREAVALACRVRLRPILMTSLATILGLIPMALALEAGSEQYAPLARAIIGGLTVSVVVTVFLVPAALPADPPQRRSTACTGGAGLRRKILWLVARRNSWYWLAFGADAADRASALGAYAVADSDVAVWAATRSAANPCRSDARADWPIAGATERLGFATPDTVAKHGADDG